MDKFYKLCSNKLFLVQIVLLLHFFVMIYLWRFNMATSLVEQINLILVTFFIVILYLTSLLDVKSNRLKFYLVVTFVLFILQFLLNIGIQTTLVFYMSPLNPLVQYFFTYSSLSIILFDRNEIAKELFQTAFFVMVLTIVSYLINPKIYATLSVFLFLFLTITPTLFLVIYYKEVQQLLSSQKKALLIYAIWNFIYFILSFVYLTNQRYSGIILLYSGNFIIFLSIHVKNIYYLLRKKLELLKNSYLKSALIIFCTVIIMLIFISIEFKFTFMISYMLLNTILIVLAVCLCELLKIISAENNLNHSQHISVLFFKRNKMVQELLSNENEQESFSEYLHNEILQNIIAIKNFNRYSEKQVFREQIDDVSQQLIDDIRGKIDYYQPMIDNGQPLRNIYIGLISKIKKRLKSDKKISINIDSELVILSPYDKIVYRFIEELITNSIKYSNEKGAKFKLSVDNGIITILVINELIPNKNPSQRKGFGLANIKKQIDILNGEIDIDISEKFSVYITIPIDEELCYEDFTN